ncbi:MAG: PhoU domain-containing protein, partial [Pirellulaceae bacterium]
MSRHLIHDLEEAYNRLLGLSATVEEMIGMSVRSLVERNADLAERVIARDEYVDQTEVRIEEECLKILAMHQPVA